MAGFRKNRYLPYDRTRPARGRARTSWVEELKSTLVQPADNRGRRTAATMRDHSRRARTQLAAKMRERVIGAG